MQAISVQDIMEKNVVSVRPDTPLSEAAAVLAKHGFDGVPVMDEQNTLCGILTEYDLISKGSAIHLPTFQKILENMPVFSKDKKKFQSDVAEAGNMKVRAVVIEKVRKVIGVVSRFDVLKPLRAIADTTNNQ